MPTPSRLLVPFVVALLVGASAPAMADEATPPTPVADATAQPIVEPTEEPTDEVTVEPTEEPAAEPTAEPDTEPREQTSEEPAPPAAQQDRRTTQRAAVAPSTVTTAAELVTALSTCEAGDTVTLGADITVPARATVACDLTLDLAGQALQVSGLHIDAGRHLTIDDSGTGGSLTTRQSGSYEAGIRSTDARLTINGGTVTAAGGFAGAGIGGGGDDGRDGGNAGVITINGGTIDATSGGVAAGIGGAGWGHGGVITINGGTVTARGGHSGSGIGSGYNRGFTSIRINGGQVTAIASGGGAAIGTGAGGSTSGASIEIGSAARVTVSAGDGDPVMGETRPTGTMPVSIDGVVHVDSGIVDAFAAAWRIGSTGAVLGPVATPQSGVDLTGGGTIRNQGVLMVASRAADTLVTGHHHRVSYDLAGGTGTVDPITLFAPTFAAARVPLPTPTRADRTFAGWTLDGAPFGAASTIGAGSTDGEAVPVTLVARWELTTAAQLAAALSDCTDEVVAVDADITVASRLAVECDVTLDLNGHTVATQGIEIAASKTFTVDDSASGGRLDALAAGNSSRPGIAAESASFVLDAGAVRADGGYNAAGIGSGAQGAETSVTINGGTVTARGSVGNHGGAGIGGGYGSAAPTVVINAGTVTAVGAHDGAGIGGGSRAAAGSVTITGGTVTASALNNGGAGIGGGWGSTGGVIDISGGTVTATGAPGGTGIGGGLQTESLTSVTIGTDAHVTAIAGDGYGQPLSALGFGSYHSGDSRADVWIDGTLRTPGGTIIVDRLDVTVGSSGQILGGESDPQDHSITGTGTVANGGVIAGSVVGTVSITGNHFNVVAPSGEDVTVYGPSVSAGYRDMPAEPTRGIDRFAGWTVDGDPLTSTTTLPGSSTDGTAVRVDLTAAWDEGVAAFGPSDAATVIANADPIEVDLTLVDGDGDPVAVAAGDWDLDVPAGLELVHGADGWRLSGTTLGASTVTATTIAGGREYVATLDVTVQHGPVASMDLDFTGDAAQDGTITVTAIGTDEVGNDLGDVSGDVTLTSSVATDVIDGNTVTFPHASPHTITATHANGTTATLVLEVTPAPVEPTPVDDDPAAEPVDETTVEDEPADAERTDAETRTSESELADTGSSASAWWLVSALALVLAGGALMRRTRRR